MKTLKMIGLATAMLLTVGTASAYELNGNIVAASDYVFRGISQTQEDPAAQGGLSITTDNGFTLGTWASNVDDGENDGAEIDVYAKYGNNFSMIDYSIGVTQYMYTEDDFAEDYTELNLNLSTAVLGGTFGFDFNWSPELYKDVTNDEVDYQTYGITYSYFAEPLWALEFHVGARYNELDSDVVDVDYNDYNVGVSRSFETGPGEVRVSVDYYDTNIDYIDIADDRVVGTVGYFF